jgi:hypothetical protein
MAEPLKDNRIRFYYEKSRFYRVIHADGVHGGISPHLDIRMAIFNEGAPVPQSITNLINDDGTLGAEELNLREQQQGVFREVEADIIMNVEVAKLLFEWLRVKISEVEEVSKQVKSK